MIGYPRSGYYRSVRPVRAYRETDTFAQPGSATWISFPQLQIPYMRASLCLPSVARIGFPSVTSSSQIPQTESACSLHTPFRLQTLLPVPGQCRAVTRCAVTRYHQRGVGETYDFLPPLNFQLSFSLNARPKFSNYPPSIHSFS